MVLNPFSNPGWIIPVVITVVSAVVILLLAILAYHFCFKDRGMPIYYITSTGMRNIISVWMYFFLSALNL